MVFQELPVVCVVFSSTTKPLRISGSALHLRNHETRFHCGSCGYASLSRGVFCRCRRSTPTIKYSQTHRTARGGILYVWRRLSCLRVGIGGRTAGQYSSGFALVCVSCPLFLPFADKRRLAQVAGCYKSPRPSLVPSDNCSN